jgi:hypothetical protein
MKTLLARSPIRTDDDERGEVPGWVLVTMTIAGSQALRAEGRGCRRPFL